LTEYRLLGPLEGPVELPGGKPRALLARLLLEAGRVVSVDALVESLWEEPIPPSAPKVLQAHVSALRKALGMDAIETRAPGYALRPVPTDLARFESLVESARAEADAARRADALRAALDLWRGEPLVEFRREPFAARAAARLAELRLDALARRIDAELELGEHERLIPELRALVEAEPLREQPRRQLMLALYRAGRQADALAVYRDARRALVDELGIEPGPALQGLERAILRQDPSLDAAQPRAERGPVVCSGRVPLALLAPLGRELVVVEIAASSRELASAVARVDAARAVGATVRTAAFTSADRASDLARLATEQEAELIVTDELDEGLIAAAPCDIALCNPVGEPGDGDVLVPFGGARDEWRALEFGAWLARAHGRALRLLGADATGERRDASRMLAAASLSLQRFAGLAARTTLVEAGADGILAERAFAIVASLPSARTDATRAALLERARVPVLLVHGGVRPGGLAPDRTLTRFSWSLGHETQESPSTP
jgi:DNA-binding SARP family transcriptional activator